MKKIALVMLTALLLIGGCADDDDNSPPPLPKWPDDYPITGDSVAVMTVAQDSTGAFGTIIFEFLPDRAPNHVRNFKWLANLGFYDSLTFHRVIEDFIIQGGDPHGDGTGGPGWTVDAEFNYVEHVPGILSMARGTDPNSAGSQFFICLNTLSHLNHQYTVFGRVISGMDVVTRIAEVPVGGSQNSTPLHKVYMTSVSIAARPDSLP